jgi:hypothetical protein
MRAAGCVAKIEKLARQQREWGVAVGPSGESMHPSDELLLGWNLTPRYLQELTADVYSEFTACAQAARPGAPAKKPTNGPSGSKSGLLAGILVCFPVSAWATCKSQDRKGRSGSIRLIY